MRFVGFRADTKHRNPTVFRRVGYGDQGIPEAAGPVAVLVGGTDGVGQFKGSAGDLLGVRRQLGQVAGGAHHGRGHLHRCGEQNRRHSSKRSVSARSMWRPHPHSRPDREVSDISHICSVSRTPTPRVAA